MFVLKVFLLLSQIKKYVRINIWGSIRNKVEIKVHHYVMITSNSHIFAGKRVKNIGENIFKKVI